ncbi:MdtK family multidrug efflux MATE transporter [Dickeya oryzae]
MQKYLSEARHLLALAIPVIIAQVSQTSMGVVDTIMAGSYSATDMAAVAVGTSIWLPVILFGHGLLMALTPVVANLNGSGRRDRIAHQTQQAFLLATGISILTMVVLYQGKYAINLMHDGAPELADKAVNYLHALLWGAPGYLFYQVLRSQCEGLSKTKPGMVIGFIGLLINIPINYVFIHGKLGMPELGGVGCGVATASVYWIMMLMMAVYSRHAYWLKDIRRFNSPLKPDWTVLRRLSGLGLPIALAMLFEVTLFAIVALLVLPLGVVNVAGHQIALNFSSLMFVLPLSVGVAATIRVGHRLGEGSAPAARVAARTSIAAGVLLAICTAIFTITLREPIAMLYNKKSGCRGDGIAFDAAGSGLPDL